MGGDPDMNWVNVGGYEHDQPGSGAAMYGMNAFKDKTPNPSVVYANFLANGHPVPPDDILVDRMREAGVHTLVAGHQPHGDAPTIINHRGIQIIAADTSYASNCNWETEDGNKPSPFPADRQREVRVLLGEPAEAFDPNDSRGYSIAELVLQFSDPDLNGDRRSFLHGRISNGYAFDFELKGGSPVGSFVRPY